ncbi:MAG: alanine racemase [Chitinispirillaceae bacterium]|nr:alanine racemase [Chitinispirillaceae bacterium]
MPHRYAPSVIVSLDNLLHNLHELRSRIPESVKVIAVVKDCAYGCGATVISQTLEKEGGVDFFAVATSDEAFALRSAGIRGDLLVLGRATEEQLRNGVSKRLIFTCNDPDDLTRWVRCGFPVDFHCNVDTGMHRLGLKVEEVPRLVETLHRHGNLRCGGVFTHMASADVPGTPTVEGQYSLFRSALAMLHDGGVRPDHIHVANSATVLRFPPFSCTHIRPGIALYGCNPDPAQSFGAALKPVVSLQGSVVSLREVPSATPVGYGGTYVTSRRTWIATIGLGYAHGVPRYLSNRGDVLIGGRRHRIAGNVTMDYFMVDAGPHPTMHIGDEAVVMGRQGAETITPDEVALHGNTIGYEVLCAIGTAVEHAWLLRGTVIDKNPGIIF